MKKCFFFFILIPVLSFNLKAWKTVSIDSRVTLSFPTVPIQYLEGHNKVWLANDSQTDLTSNIRCVATITELSELGMTKEKMETDLKNPATIKQFGVGMLGKIQGGKLISENQISFAGYPAFDYLIAMGRQPSMHLTTLHAKCIFAGTAMYSLYVYEAPSKPQQALRNRFFNSFVIKN